MALQQAIVLEGFGYCKVCARWLPKQAGGAGVAYWATEKLIFQKDKKALWTVSEVQEDRVKIYFSSVLLTSAPDLWNFTQ